MKLVRCDTKDGYVWLGIPEEYRELFLDFRNESNATKKALQITLREREHLRTKIRQANEALNKLEKRIKHIEIRANKAQGEKQ